MRIQKGFSLIELLIVVAIILVIAAIAIPNLLRSRIAANEASAVGSLRTINSAEILYNTTYPSQGFMPLAALGPGSTGTCTTPGTANACILDSVLAGATKSGYNFAFGTYYAGAPPVPTYFVMAYPITVGQTGQRSFFTDTSGVIRYNTSNFASSTDLPLQ